MICNFCGHESEVMKPIGLDVPVLKDVIGAGRRSAGCTLCGSSDRERLVWHVLESTIKYGHTTFKILHIAPESRIKNKIIISRCFAIGKNYICGDLINFGKGVEKIDITNINYPENYFDMIICNHVLEHIPEDIKAMKELYRVLKYEGRAILQVPIRITGPTYENNLITTEEDKLIHFGQKDHVRIYGNDYIDRLKLSGFDVKIITAEQRPNVHLGLNPKENLYLCLK